MGTIVESILTLLLLLSAPFGAQGLTLQPDLRGLAVSVIDGDTIVLVDESHPEPPHG